MTMKPISGTPETVHSPPTPPAIPSFWKNHKGKILTVSSTALLTGGLLIGAGLLGAGNPTAFLVSGSLLSTAALGAMIKTYRASKKTLPTPPSASLSPAQSTLPPRQAKKEKKPVPQKAERTAPVQRSEQVLPAPTPVITPAKSEPRIVAKRISKAIAPPSKQKRREAEPIQSRKIVTLHPKKETRDPKKKTRIKITLDSKPVPSPAKTSWKQTALWIGGALAVGLLAYAAYRYGANNPPKPETSSFMGNQQTLNPFYKPPALKCPPVLPATCPPVKQTIINNYVTHNTYNSYTTNHIQTIHNIYRMPNPSQSAGTCPTSSAGSFSANRGTFSAAASPATCPAIQNGVWGTYSANSASNPHFSTNRGAYAANNVDTQNGAWGTYSGNSPKDTHVSSHFAETSSIKTDGMVQQTGGTPSIKPDELSINKRLFKLPPFDNSTTAPNLLPQTEQMESSSPTTHTLLTQKMKTAFTTATDAAKKGWESVQSAGAKLLDQPEPTLEELTNFHGSPFSKAHEIVTQKLKTLISASKNATEAAFPSVKETLRNGWETIQSAGANLLDRPEPTLEELTNYYGSPFSHAGHKVMQATQWLYSGIQQGFNFSKEEATPLVSKIASNAGSLTNDIVESGLTAISKGKQFVAEKWGSVSQWRSKIPSYADLELFFRCAFPSDVWAAKECCREYCLLSTDPLPEHYKLGNRYTYCTSICYPT